MFNASHADGISDHREPCYDSPKIDSIPIVVALLRLGTKYQVRLLRHAMLKKLTGYLPRSYKNCDPENWLPKNARDYFLILAALEEVDYPPLLPAATYV